ncbi:MAG TPA: SDR family NAD(P)-dependent oxidoreductase, partial [Solirubrobacteraceae bacterium]|nr:SDR family NAD(P)-dependent oxidoreductase [Solirubrobacteraceae bacterium]
AAGARVTIADRDETRGAALAAELGHGARFAAADVTDAGQLGAAVDAAAEQAPERGLRIAVHCAGIGWVERTLATDGSPASLESFQDVIAINLVGTFNALRLSAARMADNEPEGEDGHRGVIVNTASVAAFDGQIGQIAYSASKGGIVGMTLPAARDLSVIGVRVNAIAPGIFDTPLLAALPEPARRSLSASVPFPKRLGSPGEYAALALHMVANDMLNGEVVRLDGALRMAPR